jgi:hypothetical protein
MGYLNPRVVYCLGLTTGLNTVSNLTANVNIQPNPSADRTVITADKLAGDIRTIRVYDIIGNEVYSQEGINADRFTLERNGLQSGLYIVKMSFDKGEATGKVVFN